MANFIALVYATLKNEAIDTSNISQDEAVAKFKELQEKSGGKSGENEPTPAENRKLNDNKENKVFKMSNAMKEYYDDNFKEYKPRVLSVNKLVEDNELINNKSLENRRYQVWGKSTSDYKIDEDKLKYEETQPIRVTIKNGKYLIEDGMHRIMALYNSKYDDVEVLTREE